MQQRLGLAVALLGEPEIVFLDEPTSALDPVGRSDVRALIERLRARNTTVFLNSHLLGEVERVCDRVCVVDRGRVIAEGTVDSLIGDPSTGAGRGARVRTDEGWRDYDVAHAEIPGLVARLVAEGARIHAVEPKQTTLEDRFLALVKRA
jgi:ABC-2 type transport system ATP-binding protein